MNDDQKTKQSASIGESANKQPASHAHDLSIPGMGDEDRVFRVKKMTRLCAYAMAEDNKVDTAERAVLTMIVWYDLLNRKFEEKCSYPCMDHVSLEAQAKEVKLSNHEQNLTLVDAAFEIQTKLEDPQQEAEPIHPTISIPFGESSSICKTIWEHALKKVVTNSVDEYFLMDEQIKENKSNVIKNYVKWLSDTICTIQPTEKKAAQKLPSEVAKEIDEATRAYNANTKVTLIAKLEEQAWCFHQQLIDCFRFVNRLCENLETEPARKSVFMNADGLTPDEVTDELRYIMCLIHADNTVSDVERESFRVFCKVCKIEHSTKIWRHLSKMSDKELFENRDLEVTIKDEMDLNDFSTVKRSMDFYDIQGPIRESAHNALRREVDRQYEAQLRNDRSYSRIAMILFFISALVIYFFISDSMESRSHNDQNQDNTTVVQSPKQENDSISSPCLRAANIDSKMKVLSMRLDSLIKTKRSSGQANDPISSRFLTANKISKNLNSMIKVLIPTEQANDSISSPLMAADTIKIHQKEMSAVSSDMSNESGNNENSAKSQFKDDKSEATQKIWVLGVCVLILIIRFFVWLFPNGKPWVSSCWKSLCDKIDKKIRPKVNLKLNFSRQRVRRKNRRRAWILFTKILPVAILLWFIVTWNQDNYFSVLERFFIPLCLLIMMLSIEWLIFMRGKEVNRREDISGKPRHSMLVLLVVAAIILDICIGIIEINPDNINTQWIEKCFSAVLLGCICFFSGKFIENHRNQQDFVIDKMNAIVDELKPKKPQEGERQKSEEDSGQKTQAGK